MHPHHRCAISFGIVLLAGGLAFIHQTRKLGHLRAQTTLLAVPHTEDTTADVAAPAPDAPIVMPANHRPAPAADFVKEFIARLQTKLIDSVTPEQLTAHLTNEAEFARLDAITRLTEEERAAIRQGLQDFTRQTAEIYLNRNLVAAARASALGEVRRRQDAWLAGQLGPERHTALLRANERDQRATAEYKAAAAVSRIAAAVDLSPEQRDRLMAGFIARQPAAPAHPEELALDLQTDFAIGRRPVPDIDAEAEKILTPEQWQSYKSQRRATSQDVMRRIVAFGEILPSLLPSLPEFSEPPP